MSQYDWTNEPAPDVDAWVAGVRRWIWRYKYRLIGIKLSLFLALTEAYFPDEKFTGPVATAVKSLIALLPLAGLVA